MKEKHDIIIFLLYSTEIFTLSSVRGSEIPPSIFNYSLVFHFFLYFFYGAALFIFFKDFKKSTLFGILYAMSDEIHQYFVPGRTCDPIDFLVDSIALMISLSIIVKWKALSTFLS